MHREYRPPSTHSRRIKRYRHHMALRQQPNLDVQAPTISQLSYSLTQYSVLEMHVGVICACLPSLKPLTKHYFPSLFEDHFTIPEPSLRTLPPLEPPFEGTQQSSTYSDDSGYQTNSNNDPKSQLGSRIAREKECQALASSTILPTVQQPGNAVGRGRGIEVEHFEV